MPSALRLTVWMLMGLVLITTPATALARKVDGVRLGLHPDHTRLVVDLDGPFTYELEKTAVDRIVVYFKGANLAPGWPASQRGLGRVAQVKATNEGRRVKLEVFLTGPSQVQARNQRAVTKKLATVAGAMGAKPVPKNVPTR